MKRGKVLFALFCVCSGCWFDGGTLGGFPLGPWHGHQPGSSSPDAGTTESDAGATDAAINDAAINDAGNDADIDEDAGPEDAGASDAAIPRVLRVMPVGDSIVAGYTDNPTWSVPFNFGWRSGLYKLLQAAYPDRLQYVGSSLEPWESPFGNLVDAAFLSPDLRALDQDHHHGYGAVGTYEIAIQLLDWLDRDPPDVVLLMIGINDIPAGSSDEPVQAELNLEWMVNAIVDRLPNADVVVAQITPYSVHTEAIVMFNHYIRDVIIPNVSARTNKVRTVDQYPALLGSEGIDPALFANGINHPSPEAYERMAKIWFEGLVPIFDRP